MKAARVLWVLGGIWLGSVARLAALLPAVEVEVDTARVTLGDPIHLNLYLRHRPEERPVVPPLANFLQDASVREIASDGPQLVDGGIETILHYELRLYALGSREIPPLPVSFIQASGDTLMRTTRPLEIEVLSVRGEGEESLRDIKPPVEVPGGIPLWLAGMLGVLVVVGFVFGILWVLERRKKQPESATPPEPLDYAAEFVRIAAMGLLERGDYKTYYSLLSENLRRYLEESLCIDALEQTTTEISQALKQVEIESGTAREIDNFLAATDLVKFARFIPDLENARRAPESGLAIVRAVDAARASQKDLESAAALSAA
jgi:hypothetical protein